MRILLLSMPDSFEHTPTVAVRMPNGALASLAANIDAHHEVAIADLVLAQSSVRQTVEDLVGRLRPDLVGLSVMTFQRGTARRIISLVRGTRGPRGENISLWGTALCAVALSITFTLNQVLPYLMWYRL